MAMNFVAPSPSRTIACARSIATSSSARGSARAARIATIAIGAMRALPVAAMHEAVVRRRVAVDGRAVERHVGDFARERVEQRRAIGASVAMNASIVAMSGWIMPAPFAMPVTVTSTPSMRDAARRAFRHRVGRHDRARRGEPAVARARRARSAASPSTMPSTGSGSMITPVENGSTCSGAQSQQRAPPRTQVARAAARPALAGARVRVAGVDDERAKIERPLALRTRCCAQTMTAPRKTGFA